MAANVFCSSRRVACTAYLQHKPNETFRSIHAALMDSDLQCQSKTVLCVRFEHARKLYLQKELYVYNVHLYLLGARKAVKLHLFVSQSVHKLGGPGKAGSKVRRIKEGRDWWSMILHDEPLPGATITRGRGH